MKMRSKQIKLIRKYAKKFGEDPEALKKDFKKMPKEGRRKLAVHMKHYNGNK